MDLGDPKRFRFSSYICIQDLQLTVTLFCWDLLVVLEQGALDLTGKSAIHLLSGYPLHTSRTDLHERTK